MIQELKKERNSLKDTISKYENDKSIIETQIKQQKFTISLLENGNEQIFKALNTEDIEQSLSMIGKLTVSYKNAKYYEQLFTYQLEAINQQILQCSNSIEQNSWDFQKNINNKSKELYEKGKRGVSLCC